MTHAFVKPHANLTSMKAWPRPAACENQMMQQFYHDGQHTCIFSRCLRTFPGFLKCAVNVICRRKTAPCGVLNVYCFTCLKLSKNDGSQKKMITKKSFLVIQFVQYLIIREKQLLSTL